jgi:hypothetical protein
MAPGSSYERDYIGAATGSARSVPGVVLLVVALAAIGCSAGRNVPANYQGGRLPAGAAAGDEIATTENRLAGTVWELIAIDPPDRSPIFVPDPDRYLLQFKSETALAVKADCNSCEGMYNSGGRALAVRVECVTQNCRPGSYGELYLAAINSATTFSFSGNGEELYVNFGAERGTLTFRRF